MDFATIIGLIFGIIMIATSICINSPNWLWPFIDVPSAFVTLGGTIASIFIHFPGPAVLAALRSGLLAFRTKRIDPIELVEMLVNFAKKARREGILSLENSLEEVDDPFLKNGIRLAVDGVEPDLIRDVLDTELAFIENRHKFFQTMFIWMGTYAPAYGMIGTLMGLVLMLLQMEDPKSIGPNMALAILTTFYGAVMANLFFLPIAGNLRVKTEEEVLLKEITIEGIMSIQSGDNPRIVHQKLMVFLPPKFRREMQEK